MHDSSLEQKLRAALQADGDGLSLTITAAELERRHALRRGYGGNRLIGLGIAAAVGIALLGLAGLAGGWFDQSTRVGPGPGASSSAVASPGPSATPSASPEPSAVAVLPSVDEMLTPLDPARIVRAQGVGPADGPTPTTAISEVGPREETFAPIEVAGAYRVWSACLGGSQLSLVVIPAGTATPREDIPLTCDGSIAGRQVGIESGDTIGLRAAGPISWRVAVEAPARSVLHATSITEDLPAPAGEVVLVEARSHVQQPSYEPNRTGGGIRVLMAFENAPPRDGYRVQFSCAGPTSIRWALAADPAEVQSSPGQDQLEHIATEVECDGAAHADVVSIAMTHGTSLYVLAEDRVAWHVVVTGEVPPITVAPDGSGWQTEVSVSPRLDFEGIGGGLVGGGAAGQEIRVTITCLGGTGVDITVHRPSSPPDATFATFQATCVFDQPRTTTMIVLVPEAQYLVDYHPQGKMWIAVTVQKRVPGSPAP